MKDVGTLCQVAHAKDIHSVNFKNLQRAVGLGDRSGDGGGGGA